MRPARGSPVPSPEERLLRLAHEAIDVTPLSVAAAQGLDAKAVARLRLGAGDRDAALRLARALEDRSAQLLALAAEMAELAQQD